MTCATLVTGLPVAFTFTYIFEPMKKSAHEMSIRIAGIPKPMAQLTLDCTYTMRVKDTNWAKVKVKKYQLKKLLIPFFPDSVSGLNWSAPKAKLHGRMPAAPTISIPKPVSKNAICPVVGPMQVSFCPDPQWGGCSFLIAAVSCIASNPFTEIDKSGIRCIISDFAEERKKYGRREYLHLIVLIYRVPYIYRYITVESTRCKQETETNFRKNPDTLIRSRSYEPSNEIC
jgi:hypothetical protein